MTIENSDLFDHYASIYIHGPTYSGKTSFVLNHMKTNKKDYTYVSIQDLKNDEDFLSHLTCQNVLMMFQSTKQKKKYMIVDNIDILQNSDKKMINSFIKFFKTKKHLNYCHICFIFIGNNEGDKKVLQLQNIMEKNLFMNQGLENKEDYSIKEIVHAWIHKNHSYIAELRDKNIISLCFHENMVYHIHDNVEIYQQLLDRFCKGDYYDRMSFKKQLWQFNEMAFYLKVVLNQSKLIPNDDQEVIFTKILTKFSNQYSNLTFINQVCLKANKQKEEIYEMMKQEEFVYENAQEEKRLTKLLF
jgi:hypothetical protein